MFNDPSDPRLQEPLAFCGTWSALPTFLILTVIIFLYMIPLIMFGNIEMVAVFVAVNAIHFITFYAIHNRNEHIAKIFYPFELFFWSFAVGYFSYAFCSFQKTVDVQPAIYLYWIISMLGVYRAYLARELTKWIEKLNQENVMMTAYQGIHRPEI